MSASKTLFDVEFAADLMSVSKQTVLSWIDSGRLRPTSKDADGHPFFDWSAFSSFPQVADMDAAAWEKFTAIKPKRRYTSIELFAGGGGLALGLEKAGLEHILLNELMPEACETLRINRPNWNVVEGDVSKIDFSSYRGKVDVVSGGFPCQTFSYAGKKAGFNDARGTLFFEFARVIKETQPKMFIGENVRGLLIHDGGRTLATIKSVLEDLGYVLVEPHVLKAIFYRVPQKRERLLLIGIRKDLSEYFRFNWPKKAARMYTVGDALRKGELFDSDVPPSAGARFPKRKAEILAMVPPGGYWRDLPIDVQKEYMKKSFYLPGGRTGMARRMSWNAPCLTLLCSPSMNQTERCHPSESRPFTVREYARLQTFPDDWKFAGNTAMQYKQIGNAVPVNLAYVVGLSVVDALNGLPDSCWGESIPVPFGKTHFTCIDLFAGIGGFRIAMECCGGECIGFSEINEDAINTYVANHPQSEGTNFGDITQLKDLPPHDLLTGGVPCQSWSIAGRNLGFDDDRGQLWNDALYLLNKCRPRAFIFENVKGLVDPRNKDALDYIMSRIQEAGYYAAYHVINSFDYGVPQSRVRIYIIGFREKKYFDKFALPPQPTEKIRLRDILDEPVVEKALGSDGVSPAEHGKRGATSLSANNNGFNDYFLFNDLRNGQTTIHSWDILDTTEKQKRICLLLLKNRRKDDYGNLDGNPLSLAHFQALDPSITQRDIDALCQLNILRPEVYRYKVVRKPYALELDDNESFVLTLAAYGELVPDVVGRDMELRRRKINAPHLLAALAKKGIVKAVETRYDFRFTKISTGLFGINRIFLPSSNIFPTLVASDSSDYVTSIQVTATSAGAYRRDFLDQVYREKRFRRISKKEACRIQGFPDDFILPPTRSRWMKLIGNSVSVPVVQKLVRAICDTGVFVHPADSINNIEDDVRKGKTMPSPSLKQMGTPIQMTLFETPVYVVKKSPLTLFASYRRDCKAWIVKNGLYNYPITKKRFESDGRFAQAERLVLQNRRSKPMFFTVKGCEFITWKRLESMGYPRRGTHSHYLLFRIEPADDPEVPIQEDDFSVLAGKACSYDEFIRAFRFRSDRVKAVANRKPKRQGTTEK